MTTTQNDRSNMFEDELDGMLRRWHSQNAARAQANRESLMQRIGSPLPLGEGPGVWVRQAAATTEIHKHRSMLAHRYLRAAASLALLVTLVALLIPLSHSPVHAAMCEVMIPEGGKLEALDDARQLIGPCPLKHTDVDVSITGPFARITLKQQYHNPYLSKIEAVYTFPMSHRGAVDRMRMTIGDRIVEAEMKERQQARHIYESARGAGHVAALLEQDRPNIFTQSVANIEPNSEVIVEISYVEMIESVDGEYSFKFPMVVAPRYIPGYPSSVGVRLPAELKTRHGLILRGRAALNGIQPQPTDLTQGVQLALTFDAQAPVGKQLRFPNGVNAIEYRPELLQPILESAQPIEFPGSLWWGEDQSKWPSIAIGFIASYGDDAQEIGIINSDGTGHLNNRWFFCDISKVHAQGTGYEPSTDQVLDASRITPAPVRPPARAGHDVSLRVAIDSGGPPIIDWKSDLHDIVCTNGPQYKNVGNKVNLALKQQDELPNRDFVLRWKTLDDSIQESTFVHLPDVKLDQSGGFVTVIVAPPAPKKINPEEVPRRELIFVLDTSGSMSGPPIEKAKQVMSKAIDAMRPRDTFNMITFSGDTNILWDKPRVSSQENRALAQAFLQSRSGGGGTEMMAAINAALAPQQPAEQALQPIDLANLPADGREVMVRARGIEIEAMQDDRPAIDSIQIPVNDEITIRGKLMKLPKPYLPDSAGEQGEVMMHGRWITRDGERVLDIEDIEPLNGKRVGVPLRIVMFLTDGQVGNDDAIINAVKEYWRLAMEKENGGGGGAPRVFSFGIGNSPNRYLLDGIAKAGRGEVEYVNLQNGADIVVERFVKRIETPVLTNIKLDFNLPEGWQIVDAVPPLDSIPDLFDVRPLIVHGRLQKAEDGGAGILPAQALGKLTLRGDTGSGEFTRTIELKTSGRHDQTVLPTLWARAKVEELMKQDSVAIAQGGITPAIHKQIVELGERFSIMTRYTSFVAVEKARITIVGKSVLVPVPIELPDGMEWEGTFGKCNLGQERIIRLGAVLDGDLALKQAQDKFSQGNYAQAERDLLTGKVRLQQRRSHVPQAEFEALNRQLDEQLTRIQNARAASEATSAVDAQAAAAKAGSPEEERRQRAVRTTQINEALQRVRQLQQESKYREALQVIDEILFIDEHNPAALALRDVITTTVLYRDYNEVQQIKELGLGQLSLEAQVSMIPPRPNFSGPGKPAEVVGRNITNGAAAYGAVQALPDSTVDVDDLLKIINNWGDSREESQNYNVGFYDSPDANYLYLPELDGDPARNPSILPVPSFDTAPQHDLNGALEQGYEIESLEGIAIAGQPSRNRPSRQFIRDPRGTLTLYEMRREVPTLGDIPIAGAAFGAAAARPEQQAAIARLDLKHASASKLAAELGELLQQSGGGGGGFGGGGGGGVGGGAGFDPLGAIGGSELLTDELAKVDRAHVAGKMTYPEDWPQLSFRRTGIEGGFSQEVAIIIKLHDTIIPVDFTVNTLEQIEAYFEQVTGLKIDVKWDALAAIGLNKDSTVSLKAGQVSAAKALDLTFEGLGEQNKGKIAWAVVDGVLTVSTTEELRQVKQRISLSANLRDEGVEAPKKEVPSIAAKAALAEINRIGRLRRVIDQELWPHVQIDPQTAVENANNPVMIIILASDVSRKTLALLKNLGMNIDDTTPSSNLIAGSIAAERLDDAAMIDAVRRIEAVNVN